MTEKLIEIADLAYSVDRIVLSNGQVVVGPFPARVASIRMSPTRYDYRMTVDIMDSAGILINLRKVYPGRAVMHVKYQMYHFPSHCKSPYYEHEFVRMVQEACGIPQDLGLMRFFPAENAWPELTSKGWDGQILQFYQ